VVVAEERQGRKRLTRFPINSPFLPKSMSDASTVATVKDTVNNALTTGPTNTAPTTPVPSSTSVVPQNAVPSQHSFVGSIIGDK